MKKIASFEVNHLTLEPGVYVSRIDYVGAHPVTTFDLRVVKPNTAMLDTAAIHTLEHLIATFVRSHKTFGEDILYFGPMGCLTGLYLMVKGERSSRDILPLVVEAFEFVSDFEGDIPGVSAIECGNYILHDLDKAKKISDEYVVILKNATDLNLNYK